jgi:hypothetical protein
MSVLLCTRRYCCAPGHTPRKYTPDNITELHVLLCTRTVETLRPVCLHGHFLFYSASHQTFTARNVFNSLVVNIYDCSSSPALAVSTIAVGTCAYLEISYTFDTPFTSELIIYNPSHMLYVPSFMFCVLFISSHLSSFGLYSSMYFGDLW